MRTGLKLIESDPLAFEDTEHSDDVVWAKTGDAISRNRLLKHRFAAI